MRHILILAELTFREARRRKVLWAALALGAAFIALFATGFYFIWLDMRRSSGASNLAMDTGFNFVIQAGLYVVNFLGVMLAVLTSVGTLSGEIGSHTIQSLAVKPLRRSAIVLGKWLGLAGMLVVYIVLLAGGVVLATWLISGYVPSRVVEAVLLICFQALIMLSISLLGGTRFSTVANGVMAFMLYGLAFIGGWIEQIGSAMHNDTAVDIGILTSLLVPSEAMWQKAAYIMTPTALRGLGMSPFTSASGPSSAMVIYAVVYTVAMVALAVRAFSRRDL